MEIYIAASSHDRAAATAHAVLGAKQRGVEAVIHCGDLIGAQTLIPPKVARLPVHLVHGDNVGDPMALYNMARTDNGLIAYHGGDARLEFGGGRIVVGHYPHYGYAMAGTNDWDVVCCGHSREASVRRVANLRSAQTWLINPGVVAGLAALRRA